MLFFSARQRLMTVMISNVTLGRRQSVSRFYNEIDRAEGEVMSVKSGEVGRREKEKKISSPVWRGRRRKNERRTALTRIKTEKDERSERERSDQLCHTLAKYFHCQKGEQSDSLFIPPLEISPNEWWQEKKSRGVHRSFSFCERKCSWRFFFFFFHQRSIIITLSFAFCAASIRRSRRFFPVYCIHRHGEY